MFGRVKDAMADAAETLRQAFAGFVIVLALFLLYDNLPKLF